MLCTALARYALWAADPPSTRGKTPEWKGTTAENTRVRVAMGGAKAHQPVGLGLDAKCPRVFGVYMFLHVGAAAVVVVAVRTAPASQAGRRITFYNL